jgi:hypothetical protein
MSRSLSRVTSILFVLTGFSSAFYGWLVSQSFDRFAIVLPTPPPLMSLTYNGFAILGFFLYGQQMLRQRHVLAWIGAFVTLASLLGDGWLILSASTLRYVMRGDPRIIAVYFISPFFALGLILWALDLPHTSRLVILQKISMVLIALLPFFQIFALLSAFTTFVSIPLDSFAHASGIINGVFWELLGASIWFSSASSSPAQSSSSSFANSSSELTVSSLPPDEW